MAPRTLYTSPVNEALMHGHLEVVEKLLNCGANPNIADNLTGKPALYFANSAAAVQLLLAHSADAKYVCKADGTTPLHEVAKRTSPTAPVMVDLLINAGADVNVKDTHQMTPLLVAGMLGNRKVAKALRRHGATFLGEGNPGDLSDSCSDASDDSCGDNNSSES